MPGAEEAVVLYQQTLDILARKGWRDKRNLRNGVINVPVYWHVITKSDGVTGNLTDAQILASIKVLNAAYGGRDKPSTQTGQGPSAQPTANTPFRFYLAGVTRTANSIWFYDLNERAMKTARKQGGSGVLNVYSLAFSDGTLGYAYLPERVVRTTNEIFDGVVVDYRTVPGSLNPPYNFGDTLTHEAGHWLGMYHTFQFECNASNSSDFVADTPAEATEFYGMPQTQPNRDTCTGPSFPGRDPVENFMDYTDDDGMFQFTNGQSTRMQQQWTAYRQ